MADKVKLLVQKRTALKSQITNLANLLDKDKIDKTALKLRSVRLSELYRAYEEHNDELAVLDPNDAHQVEFENIQDRFYSLAGRIEDVLNPDDASNTASNESQVNSVESATASKKRRIKLPEATLPTFNGKFEDWLSFKNAFFNMIGSQADLSDVDKLHYLKSALIGDAANKIKILAIDGINYSHAWELLERSYEVKRVLISRHLSMILNLPVLEKESTNGLSKLADDAQQHIASLAALGVTVTPEIVVHVLESKLPKTTIEKWETTLERDVFPKLDQMFEFLYKTAVCASKRERSKTGSEKFVGEPSSKKRQGHSSKKAFVLNTSRTCIMYKNKKHPLYLCHNFKQLPIPKRIEAVRNAKLCYNCLRSHRDRPCKFFGCTICQKRHNTLLHREGLATTTKSDMTKQRIKRRFIQHD